MSTGKQQEFKYKAVRIRQTNSGDWLVLFAASAIEIDTWAGVPQKKKIGTQETTGFQREENKKRINEITDFYRNEKNIIQNPLLCALRQPDQANVNFEPSEDENGSSDAIQHGFLTLITESLEELSLLELLKRVKTNLERRVSGLVENQVPDSFIRELKQRAEIKDSVQENLIESSDEQEIADNSVNNEEIEVVVSDESHIEDFWKEVAAYISVLEEINDNFKGDKFLDYSKNALISFLRPIVVVDGQHRLRAAISSAKELVREDRYKDYIEQAILHEGIDPGEAQRKIETEAARKLPISLLMNTDPAEQVFQFVVVNQKATPIKPALLGTIVSTSLSNEELERVAERLENAGIKLEESRAVTFLARHPDSPFYNLVERGMTSDTKDRLKWNVLASIVSIFRDLKGGKLFHETVDYADKWKRDYLAESKIVSGVEEATEYWQELDGPWRDVFIKFWSTVRDKLADKDNDQANNYWGNPKISNIFNKTSLTILAADFFQYLCGRGKGIDSVQEVPSLVDDWLKGVNKDYFHGDWKLHGVKKDMPGIRKRWSTEWVQYRKDPQKLPKESQYRIPLN
ncbi:hypothetical protein [Coleofasciculus sp. FACHB-T130]|uniref:hypothetical protein n=1 Tax=Cyanophyceae TaxID=3028117 RepID=UPI0016832B3D|nr:hypothetical protein [Coleofasciculus sp. FACHB-T130]MBD1881863.1 hypothetical protein [Coleofasciculus sp. FACHB-T130]